MRIPWNWSNNGVSRRLSISWDESKTKVTGCTLKYRVRCSQSRVAAELKMNGEKVEGFWWELFGGGVIYEGEREVLPYLRNGSNSFVFTAWKEPYAPWEVVLNLTVAGVIGYEEVSPGVEPVPPSVGFDWKSVMLQYGLPIAAGVAGGVAVAGVVRKK